MSRHEHSQFYYNIIDGFRGTMVDIDQAVSYSLQNIKGLTKRIETLETTIGNANRYWSAEYCKSCIHKPVCFINLTVGQHCQQYLEAEDE